MSTFPTGAGLPAGSEPSAFSASHEEGLVVQGWARASDVRLQEDPGAVGQWAEGGAPAATVGGPGLLGVGRPLSHSSVIPEPRLPLPLRTRVWMVDRGPF